MIEITPPSQAAFSIDDIIRTTGVKRTRLYEEIKAGRLKVRKCGSRTLVLASELQKWLESLPVPGTVPTPDYASN
jgi:hypothetical protein